MSENTEVANSRFTDEMLLMTARLYYIDGLPQADVARIMHVSQPQVSRLLSLARNRGIVRISVADYDPRDSQLETDLGKQLGLRNSVVIKTISGTKMRDLRYTVAHFAAPLVARTINQAKVVAVAGGRTLQDLCGQIKDPSPRPAQVIVQAMGNVGSMPSSYDALELGRQIAVKWRGSFFMLNTPVLLPNRETRNAIMNLPENQEVVQRFAQCDTALIGVGTLENSVFTDRNIFSDEDARSLSKLGVVGEVCGRLFDDAGKEVQTPFRDRVASISLEQLREIPNVIAVTVGVDRADALYAATVGGIINSVVIDDEGARALLQKAGTALVGAGTTGEK